MQASSTPAASAAPVADGPMRYRVLVVDDNRDAAQVLAMLLEVSGHDARAAYSGEEAVAAAAEFQPDWILMDLSMPQMDGFEAAERIRRQMPGAVPQMAALSGWVGHEDRKRALDAGFANLLPKPIRVEDVLRLFAENMPGSAE